jgi:hypothetical protein
MAIRTISRDEIDKLGIDERTGRLYFDGKEVAIRNGFFLLPLERKIAIVAAGGVWTTAIVNVARFLVVDLKLFAP